MQSMSITTKVDTTLCDKIFQWLAACLWFSLDTPVSSINKTDHHDVTGLLKVALNTVPLPSSSYNLWSLTLGRLSGVSGVPYNSSIISPGPIFPYKYKNVFANFCDRFCYYTCTSD
jgi:hypothetical protein